MLIHKASTWPDQPGTPYKRIYPWKMFSLTHPPWGTALKASLWVSFCYGFLSSFSESHRLWLTSALWEYFSGRFLFFSISPTGLYRLLNGAINYCFMTRWKVLLFVLSSDFSWWGRWHESLFLPQRRIKWTLIKVRKRELEREIHLLAPLALFVAFWKIKICWNEEF